MIVCISRNMQKLESSYWWRKEYIRIKKQLREKRVVKAKSKTSGEI